MGTWDRSWGPFLPPPGVSVGLEPPSPHQWVQRTGATVQASPLSPGPPHLGGWRSPLSPCCPLCTTPRRARPPQEPPGWRGGNWDTTWGRSSLFCGQFGHQREDACAVSNGLRAPSLFQAVLWLKAITMNSAGKQLRYCCRNIQDPSFIALQKQGQRASLVAQWLRICLLMQGTRVRALVWEDPTCHGAAGPVSHNC